METLSEKEHYEEDYTRYIVTALGYEIACTEVLRTQSDFSIVLSGFFPTWYTWEGISYAFLIVFVSMSWGNFPNCELIWEGLHYCGWYHACAGHIRCFSVNLEEQANQQRSSMLSFSVLPTSFYLGFPS